MANEKPTILTKQGKIDLEKKLTYLDIADKTGASTATISRVNRSLNYGCGGYKLLFGRLDDEKEPQE